MRELDWLEQNPEAETDEFTPDEDLFDEDPEPQDDWEREL